MATVWATKNGNWSDSTVWSGGVVPGTTDDVYLNTFSVTVNQNINVASVRVTATTGVTAGGVGVLTAGSTYTIQCDQYAGPLANGFCFRGSSIASGNFTFIGNWYGGANGSSFCVYFLTCSNLTVSFTGSSIGGGVQGSHSIIFSSCTNMNVSYSGSLAGGIGLQASGMYLGGTAFTVNLTATSTGSSTGQGAISNASPGLWVFVSASTINFNGNTTGGATCCPGIYITTTGVSGTTVNISGISTGGTGTVCPGVYNAGTGSIVRVYSAVSSTTSEGVTGTSAGTTTVERLTNSLGGVSALGANVKIKKTVNTQFAFYDDTNTLNIFYDPSQTANVVPAASDVRSGVSYLGGTRVGSLIVAPPSATAFGVPTDNTVGTAALSPSDVWNYLLTAITTTGSVGKLIKDYLDAAVSSRLATSGYTAPTAPPTAVQVRQELDNNSTKLANLDATVSSRLAASGYTAPSTPPSVLQIRQELDANSTKLANLDATVSSRLPTSGYTAPPAGLTAAQVRTEMDNNSSKLANLDATVSSRLPTSGYTAPSTPPTANAIATAVWSAVSRTLTSSPSATPEEVADAVWATLLDSIDTEDSIGNYLKNAATIASTGDQIAASQP